MIVERAEEEQRFLAGVSGHLAASLDYEQGLTELCRMVVPFLADRCDITLSEDRSLDPKSRVAAVLTTGQPSVDVDGSSIIVPLLARGRTLGAATLTTAESGRRLGHADLPLIEEFCRHASMTLDNLRLYTEAQRANAAKDEFLSLVSHELRTPLTGIYGAARVLHSRYEQLAPSDREDLFEVLEQQTDRMNGLIEDLLVLSRVNLGQQVELEPVMAQRVISRVIEALPSGGRTVTVRIAPDLPTVAASPPFLEQILRNLLSNAYKYAPPETPVEVHAEPTPEGEVAISVLDQGVGIKPEEIEQIFEAFYRSPGAAKQKGGMGIGLTVCKQLAEAQGGHVWARPREGGGTEIGFTLKAYTEGA